MGFEPTRTLLLYTLSKNACQPMDKFKYKEFKEGAPRERSPGYYTMLVYLIE